MHKMLMSDIDESLLKAHQSLQDTIFDTPPTHSQDADFDGGSISVNELRRFQEYLICF